MKKLILFISVLLTPVMYAQSKSNGYYIEKKAFADAVEYNDYIVDMMGLIYDAWNKAIDAEDGKTAMKYTLELKKITTHVIASLKKLEGFEGDTGFKGAVLNYATHINNISKKELPKFIKIIHTKGDFTPEMEKKVEDLIPILDDQTQRLFAETETQQFAFADKTGITIEERNSQKKLDYQEQTEFAEAAGYNNYIADMVTIIDTYWELAIDSKNKDTAIAYCDTLQLRTEKIMASLKKLGGFKGYDELRLKAYDYAEHMNSIARYELREFMFLITADEFTADSEKKAESLLPILDDKREKLFALVENEQKRMAEKFGFTIDH